MTDQGIKLTGAFIIIESSSGSLAELAAKELSCYLYQLSGVVSPVTTIPPSSGVSIVLSCESSQMPDHPDNADNQAFHTDTSDNTIRITGTTPLGLLYGVYALLEELGTGFFLGGDTLPRDRDNISVPEGFSVSSKPVFPVRGSNLHGNYIAGTAGWGESDWRFYIDQMARMRLNLFMLHIYNTEPGAGYEYKGEIRDQGPPHSSMSPQFGINPMRTSDFFFGTDRYFDQEVFGAPPVNDTQDPVKQIIEMENILREAVRYGRSRGVYAAVGFEVPERVDVTDADTRDAFEERVRQFVRRYPEMAYLCLWQREMQGLFGEDIPENEAASALLEKYRKHFDYLVGSKRIYAGAHLTEFALIAYDVLKQEASHMKLVLCGWGGDRWMRFADYAKGLDEVLPEDVIFTCHDSIDTTLEDTVSDAWGQLPPTRERWAQPWIESDGDEMWTRQANVERLSLLLPDALNKGCKGLLPLHWRTRDFEEELRYLSVFSWQPDISTERFYRDTARLMFGADQEENMAKVIGDLQRLGGRWTGIHGGLECAQEFVWTGRRPHWAFEVDKESVELIQKHAEWGSYYLKQCGFDEASSAYAGIAARIGEIAVKDDPSLHIPELKQLEQKTFNVWLDLFSNNDIPWETWDPAHGVVERLHHITVRANHNRRTAAVQDIRERVVRAKAEKEKHRDYISIERLDFLLNTIDMIIHLDHISTTLAEPGPVAGLLAEGTRDAAVRAYEIIVGTGIGSLLEAQSGKLATECEWAVLALLNLKVLPCYWKTLKQAEDLMTAIPPREVHLTLHNGAVLVRWKNGAGANKARVYRRRAGEKFHIVHESSAENGGESIYADRPDTFGRYEYAVTVIDDNGWESPKSHVSSIEVGAGPQPPRILGRTQGFCLISDKPQEVRVIVIPQDGDDVESVVLRFRTIGENEWSDITMVNHFRCGYIGMLPGFASETAVEYCVTARSMNGSESIWPVTAALFSALPTR